MEDLWQDVASRVKDLSSKPEKFLEPNDSIFEKTKILAKVLYDAAKMLEDGKHKNVTLPELIIENFDEEQVWAGVELQNAAFEKDWQHKLEQLEKVSVRNPDSFDLIKGAVDVENAECDVQIANDDVIFDDDDLGSGEEDEEEKLDDNAEPSEDDDEDEVDGEEGDAVNDEGDDGMAEIMKDPDFANMSDSDGDDLPLFGEKDSEESDENDTEEDEEKEKKREEEREKREQALSAKADEYMKAALKTIKTKTKGDRELVEDRFFKLDEMEKFLESEEARERQDHLDSKKREVKGASDDEDDEVDLFDSTLTAEKKADRAMYSEYFNDQEDEDYDEMDDEETEDNEPAPKRRMILEDDNGEEEENFGREIKSAFEIRTSKLQKQIKKLEALAVNGDKPWQMTGEVDATTRPENSLLQEHLEYENVAKRAPIVTEEVSRRLEDIIVQRIKDRVFDDVIRKIKPVENPYEYKKKLILDQEKSKLSLAEVYEQEYLKQKGDLDESKKAPGMLDADDDGPPPEVDFIKRSMKSLFAKLDTLTHFHYTPKMTSAEVKIIRNAPTITMEEVAPIAMSDANLLAPQEIVDKKQSEEIGTTERTETDKKRDRRLKKQKQRLREKEQEKKKRLVDKLNPGLGNKHSKKKVMKDLERAEKEGKLVTIKSKAKSLKSSTAFFNQLQNEASAALKDQLKTDAKKAKKKNLNAASLKL